MAEHAGLIPIGQASRLLMISEERIRQLVKQGFIPKPEKRGFVQLAPAQVEELGYRPAKGDLLRLPERPASPSYAIAAVHPTSIGDLNLLLVREDVAE